MANVPITYGSGQASIAGDTVGSTTYQQVKVVDGTIGSSTALIVNADGTANVRISGSVLTAGNSFNGSVSGTVGASIVGLVPVQTSNSSVITVWQNSSVISIVTGSVVSIPVNNQSVSGTLQVDVRSSVAVAIISGSIAASFTPPANQSVSGTVQTDVRGSVAVAIISGSIAASFTPPANQSVSGTVLVNQGTNPWIITGSVQGSFTAAANQSVSGTIGASIVGQLPAGTAVLGSVAALQGTNPWTVVSSLAGGIFPISGSVAAVVTNANLNVSGSVAAFIQGSSSVIAVVQANSVAGTYAEDTAHTTGDRGLLSLSVRNDTLSSVTSTDGDYGAMALGPAGEGITVNAPFTKWVQGTASMLGGVNLTSSVQVVAPQGASVFTYITGIQVANMGSASVLVTFTGGTNSILGFTIAPAGGGSNILYQNALKTVQNVSFSASVSGTASVYVSAQGFVAKI